MKSQAPGIVDAWGLASAYRLPAGLASLEDGLRLSALRLA